MKIVGFGDFLMHFSPIDNQRLVQADFMQVSFTGAEANVCAALSFWGEDVQFVTKVPNHALAKKGLMFLNSLRIKTEYIPTGNGRMGIYFLESGYSIRPSSVIYDRQNTLFTDCKYEDYNWNAILSGADAFYLSGITPSLSEKLLQCSKRILQEAKRRKISVFYDVNLRPSICSIERSRMIFAELCPYITHLIGNEEHLKQLLEIKCPSTEDPARLYAFTKTVQKKTNINNIAITVRRTPSANKAIIYASFFNGIDFAISNQQHLDVVDRVGSGDAFSAGVVYSVLHNFSAKDTVEFSTISNALKHTIKNDVNFSDIQEINRIMQNQSCDVKR